MCNVKYLYKLLLFLKGGNIIGSKTLFFFFFFDMQDSYLYHQNSM